MAEAEVIEVDSGYLFTVIRAAQAQIQYLNDPSGYKDEQDKANGLAVAEFIQTAIDNLIPDM